MAQIIQPQTVYQVAAPQHFVPLTGRELRAQGVHRLQVGFLGLAAMLLLVGLASVINDRVRLTDEQSGVNSAAINTLAQPTSDPLADIGVVPSADPSVPPTVIIRPAP
jgi:hypothetical protein